MELEDLWEAVKPIANPDGTFPAVDARKDKKACAEIIPLFDPFREHRPDAACRTPQEAHPHQLRGVEFDISEEWVGVQTDDYGSGKL